MPNQDGALVARTFVGRAAGASSKRICPPARSQPSLASQLRGWLTGVGSVARSDGVYVIGGTDDYPHPVGAVEVYDPLSDSWSTRASMLTPRWGPTVIAGPDGKIYAVGGTGEGTDSLATVEAYGGTAT